MCIVHNAYESRQYGSEYLATANVMQAISHRTRREDNCIDMLFLENLAVKINI